MAKKLNNYNRVVNYLTKIYKYCNEYYWNNELPMVTVTCQTTKGKSMGHITTRKVWVAGDDEQRTYELNIAPEFLCNGYEIYDVVEVILHEQVHLHCMEHGLRDTSGSSHAYHNSVFRKICIEVCKLDVGHSKKYGWTDTKATSHTIDFCLLYNLQEFELCRTLAFTPAPAPTPTPTSIVLTDEPPKKSSTRKYQCPCCKNSFRATKEINVLCMDCNEQFVVVTK